jgi:hypothetical protein
MYIHHDLNLEKFMISITGYIIKKYKYIFDSLSRQLYKSYQYIQFEEFAFLLNGNLLVG